MLPETAARLSELRSIIGIKEATGDLARIRRLRELCGAAFIIISGEHLPRSMGSHGKGSNPMVENLKAVCGYREIGPHGPQNSMLAPTNR